MRDPSAARARMVERQLRRRGISDERVLDAMARVPRDAFVPEAVSGRAYADSALPIAEGQTISQPWIVAAISQALALRGAERVLEVGTGSGYSTAVLAQLAAEVVSVERHASLAEGARAALGDVGVVNAEVLVGDGSTGLPDRGPFDAVAVHAAVPEDPRALLAQLGNGGRLVAPVAEPGGRETLTLFRRTGEGLEREVLAAVAFVPLIGREGYAEDP